MMNCEWKTSWDYEILVDDEDFGFSSVIYRGRLLFSIYPSLDVKGGGVWGDGEGGAEAEEVHY